MSLSQFMSQIEQNDPQNFHVFAPLFTQLLPNGLTPLHFAALHNSSNVISNFIFHARILTKNGNTALMIAAQKGCLEAVERLAKHESNMLRNGISALELAAQNGHLHVVEVLLPYENRHSKRAFYNAKIKGFLDICNIIIQQQQINSTTACENINDSELRMSNLEQLDAQDTLAQQLTTIQADFDQLKAEFKIAVALSQQLKRDNTELVGDKSELQKRNSCLKLAKNALNSKFSTQQNDINLQILHNHEMRKSLVELQQHVNHLQHQLSFQQDEYFTSLAKKQTAIERHLEERTALIQSLQTEKTKNLSLTELTDSCILELESYKTRCFELQSLRDFEQKNALQIAQKCSSQAEFLVNLKCECDLQVHEILELKKLNQSAAQEIGPPGM
ncbi:Ankyrin repeat-containing protein [Spironucleus salmonicida]|uniref:Ankyrin repeat-containing protein n=1 Tax=Spironucleus salmonicida TaxID=348837 RepID=V6LHG7_9EUKA|nr:Ankyrin repeat-containing protein [Spironucleus salmonicida]|eukprot:EST43733.1 Ankyrin repeat-containing protein [Spironucleus salmonicida]